MIPRGLFRFLPLLFLTGLTAMPGSVMAQEPPYPTGVPIPAKGKWINPDSVAPPRVVKAGVLKTVPAHPNVRPAGEPIAVPLPQELPVFTPGQGGTKLPEAAKVESKIVPALQSPALPALPPTMKEGARYDIQCLDEDQGLASNFISAMIEDSRGYLWIGFSYDGICRYDGRNFTLYTEKEGLNGNYVTSMMEDSRGNIWIGCYNGALSRFDGQYFTHFNFHIFDENGINLAILSMAEDRQGNLWFGTNSGAFCFDGARFLHYNTKAGLSHDNVQAIFEDSRGDIWFGTPNGLNRFDGRSFTRYAQKDGRFKAGAIVEDDQGNLWFGSGIGSLRFDGKNFARYPSVRSKLKDSQGNLWFGSVTGGVSRFDGAAFTHYTTDEGLSGNSIIAILEDRAGNLWFGTSENGLCRLAPNSFNHFPGQEGLPFNYILAITEDRQGNLWFGSSGSGIIRYDGRDFVQLTDPEGLRLRSTKAIAEDKQGHLWFGGVRLTRYDGENYVHYNEGAGLSHWNITSLLADSKGQLWAGTLGGGVNRYDGTSFTHFPVQEGLSHNRVFCITEDRQGILWFGTCPGGVSRFDGSHFTHITEKEGLDGCCILSIAADSRGGILAGVEGGGLHRYDGDEFSFQIKEGSLSSNNINTIVEDHRQRIWLSTTKGVDLLVPAPKGSDKASGQQPFRFHTFGKADGLKELTIRDLPGAAILDSQNRMWWGSSQGLTMLDLNTFELASTPPRIMLGHIEVEQQFVDFRRLADTAYLNTFSFGEALSRSFDSIVPFFNYPADLKLPHYLNNLAFHFTGIDWAAPHKIRYRFYLDGLEEDWNTSTKEDKTEYRNLPFGTFTFKVQAMGESQEWSAPFEYTFTILPPWYRTWWAYALWAALLLGMLYRIYRFLLSRQLARAEARRLQELDTVKTRLYTNITHEFRTPLTLINGIASRLQRQVDYTVREELQQIQRHGRNLLRLVNQMLDLSKLESGRLAVNMKQGNVIVFLRYLLESFHSIAEAKSISLHFQSSEEALLMDFDPEKLQQIVGNLISNGIKFTPEGGKVSVAVQTPGVGEQTLGVFQTPRVLKITVTDNGRGIPADQLDKIFGRFYQVDDSATRAGEGTGIGLTLTKELVKLLGGEIKVESELGKGSAFTVVLPITNNADVIDGIADSDAIYSDGISPIPPPEGEWGRLAGERLLIIEDNTDVVRYLSSILRHSYNLLTAPNGKAGLEKAQQENPDIILCDVMMPEMDGYEVCRRLKGDLETSHIPIVLLTARADFESRMEGLEGGADAYLAKPFEERELKIQLKKLLENRERLRQFYTSGAFINQAGSPPAAVAQGAPQDQEFFRRLLAHIEAHLSDPAFSAEKLSGLLFMSYSTCLRKVRAATGMTVNDYIRHVRMHRAARWLRETPERTIASIALEVGYKSNAYFSREFRKVMGCSPTEYRSVGQ